MTAVLTAPVAGPTAPHRRHRVVVRPAPRREPPFDDELTALPAAGLRDQRLPFTESGEPALRIRPMHRRTLGLPDPSTWGRRLLIGLTESAAGRRPMHQLAALLSSSIARGLATEFERTPGAAAHWLGSATVRSVIAGHPVDGVAELAATLETPKRVRAIALRLEERHGRWCCTRMQLG